ncbi:kelch-like protein 33 [Polypterus senegalus]|nr:kelch-like protein 33 [Polypterus senegalus]
MSASLQNETEDKRRPVDRRHEAYDFSFFQEMVAYRDAGILTDFTITLNSQHFNVHAVVLAAVSSVVLDLVLQGCQCLALDGKLNKLGVNEILRFAYCEKVELSEQNLDEIRKAASALGVSQLLELCHEYEQSRVKKEEEQTPMREQRRSNLEAIQNLKDNQIACDLLLEVDGDTFNVHRVVLAAGSDYFRGMFTSGMKEVTQDTVKVLSLTSEDLSSLITFIYSGYLQLSWDNIFELTVASMQIQVVCAISLCFDFLHKEITAESCLDVVAFAEAYEMMELKEFSDDFVLRNFQEVSSTLKFQDLSFDRLSHYLAQDGLCASNELEVFHAVVKWIRADTSRRMPLAEELMKFVRFPLMTFRQFKEVRAVNLMLQDEGCKDLYGTALLEFGWTSRGTEHYSRVRQPNQVIVLVGGDQIAPNFATRVPSKDLWFANSFRSGTGLVKQIEWRHLTTMPDPARFRHGVAVLENNLYLFGGSHFYGRCDTLKSVFRYDPYQNSWQQLADMNQPRNYCSTVILNGLIYVLGGDIDTDHNLDTVECYNPTTNTWRFSHPLDQAQSGHASVVWNDKIYTSGGFNCKYKCLVCMFQYDPEKGTTYLADMQKDRAEHVMELLGDKMYVAGGVCNLREFYTDQFTCEVFSPQTNAWSLFTELLKPHVNAASGVLEQKLYIMGGYCQEDYSESCLAHRYDPRLDKWESVGRLPGPSNDIRACVISVPRHLRQ